MKNLPRVVLPAGLLAALILLRAGDPARAPQLEPRTPVTIPATVVPRQENETTFTPVRVAEPPARSSLLTMEIVRVLHAGTVTGRERAFHGLLPELIAVDAPTAGRLAEGWAEGPLRDELLRHVAGLWSEADIGGALDWLAALADGEDRRNAAGAVIAQLARTDPAGALEVSELFQVGIEDGSGEHLAQLWTEESPREAVDWVVSRPAGAQRDRLLARIALVRAQRDPAEAAGLVMAKLPAGDTREEAIAGVLRQWAVRDPAGAADWAGQFPSGPRRTRGLAAVESGRKLR